MELSIGLLETHGELIGESQVSSVLGCIEITLELRRSVPGEFLKLLLKLWYSTLKYSNLPLLLNDELS